MKNKRLLVLALSTGLILTSCNGTTTSSAASSSTPTESSSSAPVSSSSSSSTVVAIRLSTPAISVNADGNGLTWEAVEHASKYQVKVNDGEYVDATAYAFSETVGTYEIKVKAIGDGTNYTDSEEASFTYSTKAVALSDLAVEGMTASWTADGKGVDTAFAKDGTIADDAWSAVSGSSYAAIENGKLGVCVSGGYEDTTHVYYVGEKVTKYVWIIKNAIENKAIFSKDTDVVDGITSQAYGTSGWADAGAHSILSITKADIEETEESIDFKIQQLSNAYKYGCAVSGLDGYSGLMVKAKGDGKSTLVFQIEGEFGYASYNVGVLDTNWHIINIPFADEGWKVNGGTTSLASFALSQNFTSAGALLSACTAIDTVWKTVSDAGYAYTHVYVKEVTLVATGSEAGNVASVALAGSYTGQNATGVVFKIVVKDATTVALSTLNLDTNLALTGTYAIDGQNVTIKSADDGASLTYVGKATQKGRSIAFTSATGTYASYLTNVGFSYVYVVDDFEGYTATGVGYDKNNAVTAKTGLRGNYYSDYYAGSGSDTLSGSGWSLMGSTDYLNLVTDSATAHAGTNAAKVKVGNAMRYSSYNMTDGTALAYPSGSTFSFFANNPSEKTLSVNVRLFNTSTVNSSNYAVTGTVFTLPANSGWKQYTITIDSSKLYYGYSFTFEHTSDYSAVYPLIDDIEVYGEANPHAAFVDTSVITNGTIMSGSTSTLSSVKATFAKSSTVTVVATDVAGGVHNLSGTYAVDASNNIVIDCGDDLKYTGVISSDYSVIKYTSATGTLASYVSGLFLESQVTGKTIIESFENTTEASLQSKYSVDQDINNSGSFTTKTSNTSNVFLDTSVIDSGFASGKFAMDTTAAKVGKYRYRFASSTSFGNNFTNISIRVKNDSTVPVDGYLYVCTASGTSASGRIATAIHISLAAGAGWTTFTAAIKTTAAIYGYSLFFTATATTTDVVTGFIHVDNILAW